MNEPEDRALAARVQAKMVAALARHDPGVKDRGVKDSQKLGVLKDVHLGNTRSDHPTRACLIEVEFIDVAEVDALLNTGPNAPQVRQDVARRSPRQLPRTSRRTPNLVLRHTWPAPDGPWWSYGVRRV